MNSKEYLERMTNIQQSLLEYIDEEDTSDSEVKFKNIKDLLSKLKIQDNQHEFKSFLYLLMKIVKNHHRTDNFFNKIKRILDDLKNDLKKTFSNFDLFNIFKSNKRILLILIENEIINFDEFIAKTIIGGKYYDKKYIQYFQLEIQPFNKEKWFDRFAAKNIQEEISEDFYEKRRIGENDNFICGLIRKDLLDDFIVYVNENNYPLDSTINPSIYETNNFLLKYKNNKTTLIEYAAFFGSIQIFNYLKLKNVSLTPSLWNYAIHSNNAELLQILEENQLVPENESYNQIFKESIKCHHIDISYYIQNNYQEKAKEENKNQNQNQKEKNSNCEIINSLKYYNFIFIQKDKINETIFEYLCKYGYYILVSNLSTKDIDINKVVIYIIIYLNEIINHN